MSSKTSAVMRGVWMGLLIAGIVVGTKTAIHYRGQLPFFSPAKPLTVYGRIPEFSFTSQTGEVISLKDLSGKVWIANFIFTRCGGPCPVMSGKLKKIQKSWKNKDAVRFVSFSVDPEYDTPAVLKTYGERFQADSSRWYFLTGDKEEIYKLSEQHFYLGAGKAPEEDSASTGHVIHHSSKFVLVDGEARIRGYYDSLDPKSIEQLQKNIKRLL